MTVQINVTILPSTEAHDSDEGFQRELGAGIGRLTQIIGGQVRNRENYTARTGTILDKAGTPYIFYSIKQHDPEANFP